MLDRLTYVSSTNKAILFGSTDSHILINTNDFRDYMWEYSQDFKRITNFSRELVEKTLPILIYGNNVGEIANNLFETIENDVLLNQYGKLYSGDYYMQGYFIASSKTNYTADGFLSLTLTFVTDRPYWVRETTYHYSPSVIVAAGLDYPYDYDYDFLSDTGTDEIINPSFADQNIRIIVYNNTANTITNPAVTIGDHMYRVNTTVEVGTHITIDTAEKTITKTVDSTITNIFNSRDRSSYIFQKVPSGKHVMSVSPATDIDVIILEERSEPMWGYVTESSESSLTNSLSIHGHIISDFTPIIDDPIIIGGGGTI